jgi:competence protein ComEA
MLIKRTLVSCFMALFLVSGLLAGAIDADASGKININKANKEQLIELPGIGPALAERIIEHRAAKPFKSIDELKDVKGIGDAKYDKIKDLITI